MSHNSANIRYDIEFFFWHSNFLENTPIFSLNDPFPYSLYDIPVYKYTSPWCLNCLLPSSGDFHTLHL